MTDELLKKLEDIAHDFEHKGRSAKNITGKCVRVLNQFVRPAVRLTCDKLKLDHITCSSEGEEPSILVTASLGAADELRFRCDGPNLEVFNTRRGKTGSYKIPLDHVDDSMIAGIVEEFLRSTLGLEPTQPTDR